MLKYFGRLLLIVFLSGFISICFAEEKGIIKQDASSDENNSIFTSFISFFSFDSDEFISFFSFDDNEIDEQVIGAPSESVSSSENIYTLGSGDLLKITVFNHEDLSGEYHVNGKGDISLPLIGTVKVKGLKLSEIEESLKNKLKPDYLLNPQISLQVMNFRPFYILGEVVDPKSYPFVDGMTYLNAVAIAGGYTYRAKKGYVYVIRGNDTERNEFKIGTDKKVMPGDTIRVDERFF